jgi:hypothetical protein
MFTLDDNEYIFTSIMKQSLKSPAVLTTLIANGLMAVGGAIGWFTISSALQTADLASGSTLQSNLNTKKTTTIAVAVVCILLTMVVVKWRKRWLQVLPLLLDAFLIVVTVNQLSSKTDAEALGIHYSVGYWVSLVGAVVATLGCLWIIATVRKNKQTV